MKPLRVDFHFATPIVIPANPIHLDAILAAMCVERAIQARDEDYLSAQERLPLAREERGGLAVWKASAIELNLENGIMGGCMIRRTDVEAIIDARESGFIDFGASIVDTNRGKDKNYMLYYRTSAVRTASAWCVGDQQKIVDLLKGVRHIGRMGRNGHGRLDTRIIDGVELPAIDVVDDKTAKTRWQERVLPWPVDGYEPIMAACQAPYWDAKNRRPCYVPPAILR